MLDGSTFSVATLLKPLQLRTVSHRKINPFIVKRHFLLSKWHHSAPPYAVSLASRRSLQLVSCSHPGTNVERRTPTYTIGRATMGLYLVWGKGIPKMESDGRSPLHGSLVVQWLGRMTRAHIIRVQLSSLAITFWDGRRRFLSTTGEDGINWPNRLCSQI